ncbi:response regulator transcription factor [Streptomyces sp. NPDC004539]|uniref:response regulator transcription factor n=1 Tax=Streptomyces sp. NPDC004539 TaxID=3154280 RepID=UPI0033BE5651
MNNEPCVPDRLCVLVSRGPDRTPAALGTALRFLGFDAHAVHTAEETLREVHDRDPDVVLLDTDLPDLSGVEVCRRLRAAGVDTPVIFLSSRGSAEDTCHALATGGDDYVTEPFDPSVVSARIRAVLRRSRRGEPDAHRHGVAGAWLDPHSRDVSLNGPAVALASEFALLKRLMRDRGSAGG